MKCPYCLENFTENWKSSELTDELGYKWDIIYCICPNLSCKKLIAVLRKYKSVWTGAGSRKEIIETFFVKPKQAVRGLVPPQVDSKFADDYKEACLVLADSPKASAALSRRCLQNLLREKAEVNPGNLYDEIQEVIDSNKLPSSIADQLDSVRAIGNFSAHPIKSTKTGEIIPVEPGEAEWNLDVLEELFDFYFVREDRIQKRKEAINEKLREAGKPELA